MKKNVVVIIVIITTLVAAAGVGTYALLLSNHKVAKSINNTQLSVGEKYLAQLEYEKATATLEDVITIEPNNAEAYLALAKAYRYMGDLDSVLSTLERGYNSTNSTVILNEITTLKSNNTQNINRETTSKIVEIAGKSYPSDITELILRDCGLTDADLDNLSEFTALERLDISGNNITDLSQVGKLTKLKKLYAANNEISDVSILSTLQSLEYIGLRGNKITSADTLFEMESLKYLHISDNQLTAITTIKDNLQLLYLSGNSITDTSVIQKAKLLYSDIGK